MRPQGGLRCGWVLAEAAVAERLRRLYDLIAATASMPGDALALAAFRQLPRLAARSRSILEPNWALARDFDEPRHFRLGFAVRHEDVAQGLHHLGEALRAGGGA
jgi:hypothetical protein